MFFVWTYLTASAFNSVMYLFVCDLVMKWSSIMKQAFNTGVHFCLVSSEKYRSDSVQNTTCKTFIFLRFAQGERDAVLFETLLDRS